ncbi:MAG: tetratricopeptide repeat protein [Promethearchaeota archaeon]
MTGKAQQFIYTWGFFIAGIAFIIGGLFTLASETSETIWIGGFIGGGLLIIYGLSNFGKVERGKQERQQTTSELEEAITLLGVKEYQQAQILLDKALHSGNLNMRGNVMVKSLRARCYFHQEAYDKAYTDISFVMKRDLHKTDHKVEIGDYILKFLCEMKLEKRNEAQATLTEAQQRFPNNPTLTSFLSQLSEN